MQVGTKTFGPSTLDVILSGTANIVDLCDAVNAITGLEEEDGDDGCGMALGGGVVLSRKALTTLIGALVEAK